ncbi:MAG TPA: DUF3617 family protein [Casimicrobiaceae bacterium]|nr:DUF3617 family protein [Casimicrobiaceae bacterium]
MDRSLLCIALVPALLSIPALAADYPQRKAGQWQVTITSDKPGTPPRVEELCTDAATDAALQKFALGASDQLCSKNEIKSVGGGRYTVDAVCTLGRTQLTMHGETTFTGSTAYREEVKTHYDPPLRGRSDTVTVREAKWTGMCAGDMRPGDIVERPSPALPTGMRLNVNDMAK